MLSIHFLMRISFHKADIRLNAGQFIFQKKPDDNRVGRPGDFENIQSLIDEERINIARYEELMKEAGGIVTQTIFNELSNEVDDSVLFNSNEDNRQFVKNDKPTDLLYRIISKVAEETLTFIRQKIKKPDELEHRLRNDDVFKAVLEWGLIKNLQALINRAKTELLLVKGGECSLMEGFVNNNSKFGKERYGQMTEEVFASMEKTGLPASMLFIDLDNFKQVNDQFGHDAGDEALKRTADLITKALRIKKVDDDDDQKIKGTDERVRFGGEEIGVIMEQTGANQAVIPANRIREYLEQNPLLLRQHVESVEGGEDKKSSPSYIALDRFISLVEKNGIGEIEIGDSVDVPDELEKKLKDKKWKVKKGGRGMTIALPDQRDPNSQIVLICIPITASIGVAEFTEEMMNEAQSKISDAKQFKNTEDLKGVLAEMDVTESSPYLTDRDKDFFRALIEVGTYEDLKSHLKMSSLDDESFLKHVHGHMKGIIVRRSFTELRNTADKKVYDAKEAGRNCIAVGDFIVRDKDEVRSVREIAMAEKGKKSFPPPAQELT